MKSLLRNWTTVKSLVKRFQYALLCLDYDGTLTPIVKVPAAALLPDTTRALLKTLNEDSRYTISIVSGRSLADVKNLVGLEELIYVGNHGLELKGPNIHYINPVARATKPLLGRIARELKKELASISGIFIEDKGLSLSAHFRRAKKTDVHSASIILHQITRPYQLKRKIKVTYGKKVIEIRPLVKWDKGQIVKWVWKRMISTRRTKSIIPIYVGDDRTDEDAYRAISGKGITIHVGETDFFSRAQYRLMDTNEVTNFLKKLTEFR